MSRWTYVLGILSLTAYDNSWVEKMQKRLEKNLPTGSERPLHFEVREETETIEIEGSLRNFGDKEQIDAIESWINEAIEEPDESFLMAQGIIHIADGLNENSVILVCKLCGNKFRAIKE